METRRHIANVLSPRTLATDSLRLMYLGLVQMRAHAVMVQTRVGRGLYAGECSSRFQGVSTERSFSGNCTRSGAMAPASSLSLKTMWHVGARVQCYLHLS